jgi:hypothetical protein
MPNYRFKDVKRVDSCINSCYAKKKFLVEIENLILFVVYVLLACIIEIQVLQK